MVWESRPLTREVFIGAMRASLVAGADSFAKTFLAKANAFNLWPLARGCFEDDRLGAAIIMRVGKRNPITANLELLHTFAVYRKQGLAKQLVLEEYQKLYRNALYFRVSSEIDSVGFYRALGFRFWGKQKSGCFLCMHRIGGNSPQQATYDFTDPTIAGAVCSGRKGGVVEKFEELF